MARKRFKRGGSTTKGLHARNIESLHYQMQVKDIQQWKREQKGRYPCRVFSSPEKPKLQEKENFLVGHMTARGEASTVATRA
jgi:hypothetical protein